MIGYITIGTNDLPRATRFYDELLGLLGATRTMELDRGIAWGTGPTAPMLAVMQPHDGKAAACGNGHMFALAAGSRAKVEEIYHKAIALGAKDEGPVGPRGEGFYAGYFRDLDGNKLCAFHMG